MPRAKKEHICISMKVDADVMRRFNGFCEEVGWTKTLAFERMVTEYLNRYEKEQKELAQLREHMQ